MKEKTEADLIRAFREIGFADRWVMIHSSYNAISPVKGGPDTVVYAAGRSCEKAFFPTFTFNAWTNKNYYDYTWTESEYMGAISEAARLHPYFNRSAHPIYSFAYIGPPAWEDTQNAFQEGGLFAEFYHHNGLLVNLGVKRKDENIPWPIIHYAEMRSACGFWRKLKWWGGSYIDRDAQLLPKVYSMTVRADGVKTRVKPAIDELTRQGIVKEVDVCGTWTQIADAKPFVEGIIEICRNNPEMLYEEDK